VVEGEYLTKTARILTDQVGSVVHGLGYMRALLLNEDAKELVAVLSQLSEYMTALACNITKVGKMVQHMERSVAKGTFQMRVDLVKPKSKEKAKP